MPVTPRQTFRIDEETWKEFIKICDAHGMTASQVLRLFISKVVAGEIKLDMFSSPSIDSLLHRWLKDTRKESISNN